MERDENMGNNLWKKPEGKNKGPWMGLWFVMREEANLEMLCELSSISDCLPPP